MKQIFYNLTFVGGIKKCWVVYGISYLEHSVKKYYMWESLGHIRDFFVKEGTYQKGTKTA